MDLAVDLPLIFLLIGLFAFSVFISAVETAFLRIPAVRVHTLAEEGSRSARKLAQLTDDLSEVLNAILLAALLSQIGAATVAGILAAQFWDAVGVTIASAVLTFLLYIYAEAIPKTYAVRHPDRVAITLAYPLAVVVTLLRPLVKVLVWIADIQMPGKGEPEQRHHRRANLRLEPRAGDPVHDGDLVGRVLAVEVADEDGGSEAEDGDPGKQEHEPALQVHAGVQPARQAGSLHRSSSRWNTATDAFGSFARRSASASASAIERW